MILGNIRTTSSYTSLTDPRGYFIECLLYIERKAKYKYKFIWEFLYQALLHLIRLERKSEENCSDFVNRQCQTQAMNADSIVVW